MSLVFNGARLNVLRILGRIAITLERQRERKRRKDASTASEVWENGNRYDILFSFIRAPNIPLLQDLHELLKIYYLIIHRLSISDASLRCGIANLKFMPRQSRARGRRIEDIDERVDSYSDLLSIIIIP